MRKKGLWPVVVILATLLWGGQRASLACSFVADEKVSNFEKADAVFTGTVMMIRKLKMKADKDNPNLSLALSLTSNIEATVAVHKIWKGKVDKLIKVYTNTTSCGSDFERGQKRLFFTKGPPYTTALPQGGFVVNEDSDLKDFQQKHGEGHKPY